MKKLLLVLTVVLAGSLVANAKVIAINFNFDGFCDGMNLLLDTKTKLIGGVHNVSACGLSNIPIAGTKHGMPLTTPPNATPVLEIGDPVDGPTFVLMYLVSANAPCQWVLYGNDAYSLPFLINFGTCSARADANVGNPNAKKASTLR